jgi:GNAT superfamily N-acetyltransferase
VSGPGAAGTPSLRLARSEDLAACTNVWRSALADYLGRLNADGGLPVDLEPLRRLLAHLLETDPERFVVAERPGEERIIGFGSANVRGEVWFLAMLFVEPGEQRSGIGGAILRRLLAGSDGLALGTATDSAQPISNALYARSGIVPRVPCLNLVGRPSGPGALPGLPLGVQAVAYSDLDDGATSAAEGTVPSAALAAVAAIDRELLGYERPADHAWLVSEGRSGWLFQADGRAVGYGYVSRVGRLGPVAALDAGLLAPVVGWLLDAHEPAGPSSVWVPGSAGTVVEALLRAGLRLEPFPALFCWTRPIADFERYLPISLALV